AGRVRAELRALAYAAAAAARCRVGAGQDRALLDRVGETMPTVGTLLRRGRPLADHAQGAHLWTHRRNRRGADHVAAGADGGRAQLGLSLLLAARRHAHAARFDERRLYRRGAFLARVAGARGRRQSRAGADHVRDRRRAAADRMAGLLASEIRKIRACARRETRLRATATRRGRGGHGGAATTRPARPGRPRTG